MAGEHYVRESTGSILRRGSIHICAGTAVRYEVTPASDHEKLVTQNVHTLSETPSLLPPSADELHGLPRSAGYNLSAEPKGAVSN